MGRRCSRRPNHCARVPGGRRRISHRIAARSVADGRDTHKSSAGGRNLMKSLVIAFAGAASLLIGSMVSAQDIPPEYQQVLTALGKQGDYKANVLKVNIPRNDLSVTVASVKTPTPFGFGGWVAMTKGAGGMNVL